MSAKNTLGRCFCLQQDGKESLDCYASNLHQTSQAMDIILNKNHTLSLQVIIAKAFISVLLGGSGPDTPCVLLSILWP
jgi:hypothetical protein